MPHRYYSVAGAIGYARGLIEALGLIGEESQLDQVFQHVMARLMDQGESDYPANLQNLVRDACEERSFDWVIEDAWPCVKQVLKERFDVSGIEWIDEPDKQRKWAQGTVRRNRPITLSASRRLQSGDSSFCSRCQLQ